MVVMCKKFDVFEMCILSFGYIFISLFSKDCFKLKVLDFLRLKYNVWCLVCSDLELFD